MRPRLPDHSRQPRCGGLQTRSSCSRPDQRASSWVWCGRACGPRMRDGSSTGWKGSSRTSSRRTTRTSVSSHWPTRSSRSAPMRRPRGGLWSHRDFLNLWAGQSISEFGSQISGLAIPWLAAVSLHASPLQFSLLGVLGFLPFIVFALPAGVWIDRLRRRPILIVGDASRAVLLALVPILWAAHELRMWHLLVIQFVVGIFTVFFDVAYQSYLPSLDERAQLVEGNAKLQVTASTAQVAGPGVAGALISALTAPYAIVLDAASFVVSTLFMLPIRRVETVPERTVGAPKPKMLPELKEGLDYVVRHRYLRAIAACTGSANFFGSISFTIALLYLVRSLHMSSLAVGFVFAV